jgi:dihydroorotate dehydrogenase electron transfer subunit
MDKSYTITKAQQSSGCLHKQIPEVLPLLEKRKENEMIVSLFFPMPEETLPSFSPRSYQPGQFIMVWVPGVGEKPFVISYLQDDRFGITVLRRGEFTGLLCDADGSTTVGFRGPYGRGFWGWEEHLRIALIGGGCGMASIAPLADICNNVTIVQGAQRADQLIFTDRFKDQILYTEDGSGPARKGLPTAWLHEALREREVDLVYTCGPELMMKGIVDACAHAEVPSQAALERYMKCGIGICGQCECDGRLVCKDGPVFSGEELRQMPSFGRYRRDATGQKKSLETSCTPNQTDDDHG